MKTILAIGDTHMPFMDKSKFTKLLDLIPAIRPEIIIQVGDLYDMFSQGRWANTRDLITPKEELTQGRIMAEEFWKVLQKRAPNAICYQIRGNHDDRPMKAIINKAPELASLLNIDHLWEFKDVISIHDSRQELFIDNICFIHGYRSRLGDHARYNQCSTVCGHSHQGGVAFLKIHGKGHAESNVIFELNAGYLGDEGAIPFRYTAQKINKWTHGFGLIDKYGPRFCPL